MQPLTKETLRIFWDHSKKYPRRVVVLLLCIVGVPLIRSYPPLLYRDLINTISRGRVEGVFEVALYIIISIFIVNLAGHVVRRAMNLTLNSFVGSVMRDLTNTCFEALHRHSFGFFSSNFAGSLVTKVKRYERSFERLVDQLGLGLGLSFLYTVIILGVLLWQYPTLGFILLGWTIIFLLFSLSFARFKLPYDIRQAEADTRTTGQLADSITNNINIKLFTNYPLETARFGEVIQSQFNLRKKSWDLGAIGNLIQGLLMITLEVLIMYFALKMWQAGTLRVGDIALLQAYIIRIIDQLWGTSQNTKNIYEALADANEMTETILLPNDVLNVSGAKDLKIQRGKIDFKNASFTYRNGVDVLNDFNLAIKSGERVAFVGPSGGGKSTIVKLLLRFYNLDNGEISIDGQDIARVTQDSLRGILSLVPQDPILFHRSIMENIRYARPSATDEEVIEAAKLAHVHEFVVLFPDGYNALVGERGIKLSGGERQRVAIARAILKDAPILVLDEATSSLDSESEMYIQDALKKLMRNRTTIVVAHRLSTIMQMDRILVINGGKIIEEGKHKELLKAKKGIYQRLWEIQAGGFANNKS